MSKQNNDFIRLMRIKAIPDSDIEKTDLGYEVTSNDKRNQGEVKYFVYQQTNNKIWFCSCNDYKYKNNEDNPTYQCKHIDKILDYEFRQLVKEELNKAKTEQDKEKVLREHFPVTMELADISKEIKE